MVLENNIENNLENVNKNIDYGMNMVKVREEVLKKFSSYRKTLSFMAADAPIEILGLPLVIQNALIDHGCFRIYDLFDCDFSKIKGLGVSRIRDLTSSLDKFFSML